MRSLILGGALALAAGCTAGAASPPPAPPPREVEVLPIAASEVRDTSEYLGSLLSRASVTVLPQVNGYVRQIRVRPGQRVKAGDPLFEIDAREEAAALASAQAQRQSARTALDLAHKARARAESLYKEGLATAEEIDQREADVAAAQAAARASGAQVSQQQVRLQYNIIRAPVPGVIGDVSVRQGEYVQATTQLTSIAQADALELTVALPAARARGLEPGKTPIEILAGDGKILLTTLPFYVSPEADPRTQLVELKAMVDNTVGLRPSEVVRARVVFGVRQALQIPLLAVVRQSGKPFALVVVEKDGKQVVERRPLALGPLGAAGYQVEDGLAAGDQVVVSSVQALRDGAPVKVKPAAPPAAAAAPTVAPLPSRPAGK